MTLLFALPTSSRACDFCFPEFGGDGPTGPESAGPHFLWTFKDSLAACPAGDTLVFAHGSHSHPSRLRMEVWYNNSNCTAKPDIPPDSIWVTWTTIQGNAKPNDKAVKTFADDSTDICGHTWITIPSFSGCGKVRFNLFISGVAKGNKTVVVRTADTNADGRVTFADAFGACDVNYDGEAGGTIDISLVQEHVEDWRLNALHGTPVQRTSMCPDCGFNSPNTLGIGNITWEPNGNRIGLSVRIPPNGLCAIHVVPSDPAGGNDLTQFTFPPVGQEDDYDPTWSPVLGREIVFNRGDWRILRKGVAPVNPDTSEALVTSSGPGWPTDGDLNPAFHPGGDTIAFIRYNAGAYNVFKIPIAGGTATQLTFESNVTDFFPQWSPDGQWIYFERSVFTSPPPAVYRVSVQGGTPTLVYSEADLNVHAPSATPDGRIVLAARATSQSVPPPKLPVTIDPALALPPPIVNYSDYATKRFPSFPQISPDGTRLAFLAAPPHPVGQPAENEQLWAVRRNMNLPPVLAQIGGSNEMFVVEEEDPLQFTVSATDPESDALTYSAAFLRTDLGMSFDPASRTFSWTPPEGTANATYNVRFTVSQASAGVDWQVVRLKVIPPGLAPRAGASSRVAVEGGGNPSRGPFVLETPRRPGTMAGLRVFDVSGRVVYETEVESGGQLIWKGRDRSGERARSGIYFYQLRVGTETKSGKWVLLR